jgi:hypothetical protein
LKLKSETPVQLLLHVFSGRAGWSVDTSPKLAGELVRKQKAARDHISELPDLMQGCDDRPIAGEIRHLRAEHTGPSGCVGAEMESPIPFTQATSKLIQDENNS